MFKRILLNENIWISNKISLIYVPWDLIGNMQALVQIMAWSLPGDKPFSEPIMTQFTDPDSKVHGANITGPIRHREDPGGSHVGPMNFAIWGRMYTALEEMGYGKGILLEIDEDLALTIWVQNHILQSIEIYIDVIFVKPHSGWINSIFQFIFSIHYGTCFRSTNGCHQRNLLLRFLY